MIPGFMTEIPPLFCSSFASFAVILFSFAIIFIANMSHAELIMILNTDTVLSTKEKNISEGLICQGLHRPH